MTAIWVQRQRALVPSNIAAQIEWLRHRHHCWDPIGGPMPADIEEKLDLVNLLWARAKGHEDQADLLRTEANAAQSLAEEQYEQAEAIWAPIIESHPEWHEAFIMGVDPRTVDPVPVEDEA